MEASQQPHLQAQRHKVSQVTRKMASPRIGLKLRMDECQTTVLGKRTTQHTVGGGFCNVIINTFMGGYLAKGAWP